MNFSKTVPVIGGVTITAIVLFFLIPAPDNEINNIDFTYKYNSKLQEQLQVYGISMSNPIEIKGDSINEYCNFFKDSSMQRKIKYCTSTEIKDSGEDFLGNIHMVGDLEKSQLAMAIIQTDPFFSERTDLEHVFQTMIQTLVCDCWEEQKPGGFGSISEWIQATQEHHLEAKRITSKSEITGLAQKEIILEITTNADGYLWKLLIDK